MGSTGPRRSNRKKTLVQPFQISIVENVEEGFEDLMGDKDVHSEESDVNSDNSDNVILDEAEVVDEPVGSDEESEEEEECLDDSFINDELSDEESDVETEESSNGTRTVKGKLFQSDSEASIDGMKASSDSELENNSEDYIKKGRTRKRRNCISDDESNDDRELDNNKLKRRRDTERCKVNLDMDETDKKGNENFKGKKIEGKKENDCSKKNFSGDKHKDKRTEASENEERKNTTDGSNSQQSKKRKRRRGKRHKKDGQTNSPPKEHVSATKKKRKRVRKRKASQVAAVVTNQDVSGPQVKRIKLSEATGDLTLAADLTAKTKKKRKRVRRQRMARSAARVANENKADNFSKPETVKKRKRRRRPLASKVLSTQCENSQKS